MSQLLAMSFDNLASPSITLKVVRGGDPRLAEPYGWGFAWYPFGEPAALVVKDPTSIGDNAMTKVLRDWERFQSSVFLCHLRGAAKRVTQQDTHPFCRSWAGRDWVMAHNGDLLGDLKSLLPLGDDSPFEPVGHTDSERAFCWLLSSIRSAGARRLGELGWPTLHGWLAWLNSHGTANLLVTDGQDLVVHQDGAGFNPLHWVRRRPPHREFHLESNEIALDLGAPLDTNRTMVLVSTTPLSADAWQQMEPGQTLVVRRGVIVWNSEEPVTDSPPGGVRPVTGEVPDGPSALHPRIVRLTALTPRGGTPAVGDGTGGRRAPTDAVVPEPLPSASASAPSLVPSAARPAAAGRGAVRIAREPCVLTVTHETHYRYEEEVEHSRHLFRLRPVHDELQTVLEHRLDIFPGGLRRDYDDVFGNGATHCEIEVPYTNLRVVARSRIRLSADVPFDLHSPSRRQTFPLVWMPWQRQMMTPYLLPPELPESQLRELSDYAMSFVERQDHDLVEALIDMNNTIRADYRYEQSSTTLETTPWDVYCDRRGVCQDFANLFICLARLLNVPARYRVGYIYTGNRYDNREQSDASHAWAEVYIPHTGWRGFDPTNGCLAGTDHVRVAVGRNYRDATPTSGTIYAGGRGERLSVAVKVEREG